MARTLYKVVPLDTSRLVSDATTVELYATTCAGALGSGRSVLAHTGPADEAGPKGNDVALACGRLLSRALELAPHVRRVGVAGGDTSSLSVRSLDIWGLSFIGALGPGVGLVRAHSDRPGLDGMELMLKGGQMGSPEVFDLLLRGR
jgi:3-oxoisoapionate kinase